MTTRVTQRLLVALVLLVLPARLFAQATHIITSGTLPTTCRVGDIYYKSGASAGFYTCSATNTWSGPVLISTAESANTLFAGPTSGGAALPAFRAMVSADMGTTLTPQFARVGFGAAADSSAVAKFAGQYWSVMYDDGNSSTAATIDWDNANEHYIVLTGNVVFTFSNPKDGGRYVLVMNTGAGSFTASWPGAVLWPGGTAPTITTTAAKVDVCTFIYSTTTGQYYGACNQNY